MKRTDSKSSGKPKSFPENWHNNQTSSSSSSASVSASSLSSLLLWWPLLLFLHILLQKSHIGKIRLRVWPYFPTNLHREQFMLRRTTCCLLAARHQSPIKFQSSRGGDRTRKVVLLSIFHWFYFYRGDRSIDSMDSNDLSISDWPRLMRKCYNLVLSRFIQQRTRCFFTSPLFTSSFSHFSSPSYSLVDFVYVSFVKQSARMCVNISIDLLIWPTMKIKMKMFDQDSYLSIC